jgi:hypothetical protein
MKIVCLKVSFRFFGMAGKYFSKFLAMLEVINFVPNQPGYYSILSPALLHWVHFVLEVVSSQMDLMTLCQIEGKIR